jgi:hypothetical protein
MSAPGDGEAFMSFLEAAAALLKRAVKQLKAGDNVDGATTLERAVRVCESHPSFALRCGEQIACMRDVVEACVCNAMHRRTDVEDQLGNLLKRIERSVRRGCTDGESTGSRCLPQRSDCRSRTLPRCRVGG